MIVIKVRATCDWSRSNILCPEIVIFFILFFRLSVGLIILSSFSFCWRVATMFFFFLVFFVYGNLGFDKVAHMMT